LILSCGLSPHLLAAKRHDIRTAFLSNWHPRFIDSIRSLIVPPYETEAWKSTKVTQKDLTYHLDLFKNVGTLDVKNQYIHYSQNTGTGPITRTYALYFDKEGLAVLAISEQNPSSWDAYTGFAAICQTPKDSWEDCTSSVFPNLKIEDFVKEGLALSVKYRKVLNLYYELPRVGTKIKVSVIYDNYPYPDMGPEPSSDPRRKELLKLTKTEFSLKWDKENKKFVIQP
jgi:hypothetical protein